MNESVALLAEGVDRNTEAPQNLAELQKSPSSQRAWIEMPMNRLKFFQRIRSPSSQRAWIEIMDIKKLAELLGVALLAEGVDRNNNSPMNGRKSKESPSSQRAWIEIIRLRS